MATWSRVFRVGICLAMCLLSTLSVAGPPKQKDPGQQDGSKAATRVALDYGVSRAALAARVAMEGEKRQSPILLLAAAEMLSELKESPAKTDGLKVTQSPADTPKGKMALQLDIRVLVDKATKYAKGDKPLSKLLEARAEQLSTRGLLATPETESLPTLINEGVTFKVLYSGVIAPGQTFTMVNIPFEGQRPAALIVEGDGDGDLDLWVSDAKSDALIGKDIDSSSKCIVVWKPRYAHTANVLLKNVGAVAERFVLVANW